MNIWELICLNAHSSISLSDIGLCFFISSFRHRAYLPFLRSALEVETINTASASIFKTGVSYASTFFQYWNFRRGFYFSPSPYVSQNCWTGRNRVRSLAQPALQSRVNTEIRAACSGLSSHILKTSKDCDPTTSLDSCSSSSLYS